VGLSGADDALLSDKASHPAQFGFVGIQAQVKRDGCSISCRGYMPCCHGQRFTMLTAGPTLTVNGDDAARKIAVAFNAERSGRSDVPGGWGKSVVEGAPVALHCRGRRGQRLIDTGRRKAE